jgi:hypothetical protein
VGQRAADNEQLRAELNQLLDRREAAEEEHEQLMVVLKDIYETIHGADVDQTWATQLGASFSRAEVSTRAMEDRRASMSHARWRARHDTSQMASRAAEASAPTPGGDSALCPESPVAPRFSMFQSLPRDLSEPASEEEEDAIQVVAPAVSHARPSWHWKISV